MDVNLKLNTGDFSQKMGEITRQMAAINAMLRARPESAGGAPNQGTTGSFGGTTGSFGGTTLSSSAASLRKALGPTASKVLKAIMGGGGSGGAGGGSGGGGGGGASGPGRGGGASDPGAGGFKNVAYGVARASGLGNLSVLFKMLFNPETTAIAAVVGALVLFQKGLEASISALNTFRTNFWKSGASMSGAKSISGIASALGIDPGSVAGAAGQRPGASGQFLAQIKAMLGMKSDVAAFHMAKALGITEYLPLRDFSKSQQSDILSGKGFGYTKSETKEAAQATLAIGKAMEIFRKSLVHGFMPLIKELPGIFNTLNPLIVAFGKALKFLVDTSPLLNFIKLILRIQKWWDDNHKTNDKATDKIDDAADKMQNAADTFSNAVGAFGGISTDRAAGAFPQAWAWYGNEQARLNDSKRLGAFSI